MIRIFLVLVLLLWPVTAPLRAAGPIKVAILPFATPRNQPDIEQYGEGTMDSLITGLGNVPQFIMIDRGRIDRILKEQAFSRSGLVDPETAAQAGRLLGAQVLITGSIQIAGKKIRIVANFTEAKTGQITASEKVTGPLPDIFDLMDQLAGLFIHNQKVALTADQQQRIQRVLKSTANLTAYDHYLKGRKAYLLFTPVGYSEAVEWYQKAIEADAKYTLAYAGLAETWTRWGYQREQNGQPHQAEYHRGYANAQKALALNPSLPEAQRSLAMAGHRLAKPGAEAAVRQALALNPNDAESWLVLWQVSGQDKDPDHAYILKTLELNPDLAAARNNRCVALRHRRRYEEAVGECRAAIRLSPDFTLAHLNHGIALNDLKRYDEAMAALREALRTDPTNANAHNSLGNTLNALKRYDEAMAEFRATLRINPNNANAHNNMGNTYFFQQRYEEAIGEYREATRLSPKLAQGYVNMGVALKELERYEEAAAMYREALRIDPGHGDAHYNLGFVLKKLQRYDEAAASYREAIRIDPNDAAAHLNLGNILDLLGRKEEAIGQFERYLQLEPNADNAAQVRARIGKLRGE